MKDELVDVGVAEVRVRDVGQTLGSPVVFAADAPNFIEHYDALLQKVGRDRRALVMDMPGFGFSRVGLRFDFSRSSYVTVVQRLFRQREIVDATLVFPCAWGYVALELADSVPVQQLILPQTPSWPDIQRWVQRVDKHNVLRRPLLGQAFMALRAKQVARDWYDYVGTEATCRGGFSCVSDQVLACGGRFKLASMMQGFLRGPAPRPLRNDVPCTVLWGNADRSHRSSEPGGIRELVPSARVLQLEGAGHFPELEQPERWLATLSMPSRAALAGC